MSFPRRWGGGVVIGLIFLAGAAPVVAEEILVTPAEVGGRADLQRFIDRVGPGGTVSFQAGAGIYDLSASTAPIVLDEPVTLRAQPSVGEGGTAPTLRGSGIRNGSVGFRIPNGAVVDGIAFSGLKFENFDTVIEVLGGRDAAGGPGSVRNLAVEECEFDGYGWRAVQIWGVVSRTRIVRNVFRGSLGLSDSVSVEADPRPDGFLRPDLTLSADNRFVGPPVHIQVRRAHRTLAVRNHIETTFGGMNGGIGVVWGGSTAPYTDKDCTQDSTAHDPGAFVGNTVVTAPAGEDTESALGWIGVLVAGPDPSTRVLVADNTVENFTVGVAVTLMARGVVVAGNRIDATSASVVIGASGGRPVLDGIPQDSERCGPSSCNSVLQWESRWSEVLSFESPRHRWFVGGRLNAIVNCIDRHVYSDRRNKAFVVLRAGTSKGPGTIASLHDHVREDLGPIATPSEIEFGDSLTKTRSGKIVRRLLRAESLGEDPGDLSTLAD